MQSKRKLRRYSQKFNSIFKHIFRLRTCQEICYACKHHSVAYVYPIIRGFINMDLYEGRRIRLLIPNDKELILVVVRTDLHGVGKRYLIFDWNALSI